MVDFPEPDGPTTATITFRTVIQETYDPEAYARLHPSGPKADYAWRLDGLSRAFEGGVDFVPLLKGVVSQFLETLLG